MNNNIFEFVELTTCDSIVENFKLQFHKTYDMKEVEEYLQTQDIRYEKHPEQPEIHIWKELEDIDIQNTSRLEFEVTKYLIDELDLQMKQKYNTTFKVTPAKKINPSDDPAFEVVFKYYVTKKYFNEVMVTMQEDIPAMAMGWHMTRMILVMSSRATKNFKQKIVKTIEKF